MGIEPRPTRIYAYIGRNISGRDSKSSLSFCGIRIGGVNARRREHYTFTRLHFHRNGGTFVRNPFRVDFVVLKLITIEPGLRIS